MCGCEHHWDSNMPCTCNCPEHALVRDEMARRADQSGMSDAIELEDIKRLTLNPDDVLVVRFVDRMPRDHIVRLVEMVRTELPHHNKVLVLDGGASLDILTAEQLRDLAPDG